jgi:predicted RNA-binding Zn-ribbon protein involved in translation (DUF1610 family)
MKLEEATEDLNLLKEGDVPVIDMTINQQISLVKKIKLVTDSMTKRYYCKKCKGYFDNPNKYTTFKCTLCGEMNQITDDMIKKMKNVNIFEVKEMKIIEEGEGNYVLICNVDGDTKVKVERLVV